MTISTITPVTSASVAVTATAATLTSSLDTTKPPRTARYQLVSSTAAWIAQGIADTTFTADAATDVLTIDANPALITGAGPVQLTTSGGLPGGLAAATNYFVIVVSSTQIKLATTRANALAGTAIDVTSAGTGTHTATTVATAAGAGSHFVPAGVHVYLDGTGGAKVSIVRDAADGRASIAAAAV